MIANHARSFDDAVVREMRGVPVKPQYPHPRLSDQRDPVADAAVEK